MPPVVSEEVIQIVLNKRQEHLTRAEYQRYWRDVHGPLTGQHSKYTLFYHCEPRLFFPFSAFFRLLPPATCCS